MDTAVACRLRHLLCVKKQATKPQKRENSNGGISSLNECMELDHCLLKSTFPHCLGLNNLLHKSVDFSQFLWSDVLYTITLCDFDFSRLYILLYCVFISFVVCVCRRMCVCFSRPVAHYVLIFTARCYASAV